MALLKKISTNLGIDGEYVKVNNVRIDMTADGAGFAVRVVYSLYFNSAVRQSGKQPLISAGAIIPSANITAEQVDFANALRMGYLLLKTLPEFAGAQDC